MAGDAVGNISADAVTRTARFCTVQIIAFASGMFCGEMSNCEQLQGATLLLIRRSVTGP